MLNFTKVLKENPNGAYDYIANNFHKYSKTELADIAKELLYTIYSNTPFDKELHDKMLADVAENLEDDYAEEE